MKRSQKPDLLCHEFEFPIFTYFAYTYSYEQYLSTINTYIDFHSDSMNDDANRALEGPKGGNFGWPTLCNDYLPVHTRARTCKIVAGV